MKVQFAFFEMVQEWRDEMLRWDPRNYDGLKEIIIPVTHIWVPDLYIFNKYELFFKSSINLQQDVHKLKHFLCTNVKFGF